MYRFWFFSYLIWTVHKLIICTMVEKDISITRGSSLVPRKSPSQTRIINGESVSGDKYPFLAQVYLKVFDRKGEKWYHSGGSIVTSTIIITCGHCICVDESESVESGSTMTCRNTKTRNGKNQNRKGLNEIYYSIGIQKFDKNTATYCQNIKVYLYEFEPFEDSSKKRFFSKNGDIAAIKDVTMDLTGYKATTINLPTSFGHETFGDKAGRDAKTAGRGSRYIEWDNKNPFDDDLTSCTTNEGLAKSPNVSPSKVQIFIPCKDFSGPLLNDNACVKIPIAQNVMSFHSKTKVIVRTGTVQFVPPYSRDVCNNYWRDAIKHIEQRKANHPEQGIFTLEEFISKADRIVVCDKEECYNTDTEKTDIMKGEICYNVKKLGEFGVCNTALEIPYNWGFCSKSCGLSPEITEEPSVEAQFSNFEKLTIKYYDTAPPDANLFESSNCNSNFLKKKRVLNIILKSF